MNFDIKDVKTWNNRDNVEVGDKGYFANDIHVLDDFVSMNLIGTIEEIDENGVLCFKKNGAKNFGFFLPLDAVKKDKPEKKYRPFETIEEFVKTIGDIGTIITYREKKEPSQEMKGIFTGYMWDRACRGWILGLGATLYRLENLFELAEYKCKNEWQPFGVEE